MELLQLRYFKELAESEHLTNTAKKLMISPPSLSLTISKLEQEIGTPLFDRTGRNLRLNDFGELFYQHVSKGLSFIDMGIYEIDVRLKFVEATLNLVISSTGIWDDLLKAFRQAYPHVTVHIDTMLVEEGLLSENKKYDFFFGVTREMNPERLNYRILLKEEHPVVLIPKKNPLSKLKSIQFEQLKNENFITVGEVNPTSSKYLLDMCTLANFTPKKVITANYFTRMKYLEENKGVALSTGLGVIRNSIKSDFFSIVPVTSPQLTKQQALAWKKDVPISSTGSLFLDFALQYCSKHLNL